MITGFATFCSILVNLLKFVMLCYRKLKDEDKIQRKQRAAEAALKPKFFELSQGTELDMRRDEHHQHKSQMRSVVPVCGHLVCLYIIPAVDG